jgi:hypothetical protein
LDIIEPLPNAELHVPPVLLDSAKLPNAELPVPPILPASAFVPTAVFNNKSDCIRPLIKGAVKVFVPVLKLNVVSALGVTRAPKLSTKTG